MLTVSASEGSHSARSIPSWLMLLVSFWGGLHIMVLEVCGFRVLQNNLGSSVIVTGTLLTLVMVLLSAGYYVGGRLSSAWSMRRFFLLLLAAAVYVETVTAGSQDAIAELCLTLRANLLARHPYLGVAIPAAVLSLLSYGPPVFAMSMISPYWIRCRTLGTGSDAGAQSGFFMSLSTLGSIAGTVVASYFVIPFYGAQAAVLGANAVFLALTSIGWFETRHAPTRPWLWRAGIALAASGLSFAILWSSLTGRDPSVVYQAESHYGQIQVTEHADDAQRRVLEYRPSRLYLHSSLYPDDPLHKLRGLIFLIPTLLREPQSILVLGSAAGGTLRQIERVFPHAKVTGVDVDPQVHRVALDVFGVDPNQSELVAGDARVFLDEDERLYDLVIVDLFAGEFIPPHCITVEFFRLVHRHVAPGGAAFINTNMSDLPFEEAGASEPFRPIRNLESTLAAAGFRSLFENSFFHSLFAYPRALSVDNLRQELLARVDDTDLPLELRAAAGLAAYTTASVQAANTRYRPFSDRWSPEVLIGLKSNASEVLEAVERTGRNRPASATLELESVVLQQLLRELTQTDEPGRIVDEGALVDALNQVAAPAYPLDIDRAARQLRFSPAEPIPAAREARSDWARLALAYSQLYRFATQNDAAGVLSTVRALRAADELPPSVASAPALAGAAAEQ